MENKKVVETNVMNRPEGLASLILTEWLRQAPPGASRQVLHSTKAVWHAVESATFGTRLRTVRHKTLGGLAAQLAKEVPEFAGDVVVASFTVADVESALCDPDSYELGLSTLGWTLRALGSDGATLISREDALRVAEMIELKRQGRANGGAK